MSPELNKFILKFLVDRNLSSGSAKFQALPGDGSKRIFWRIIPPASEQCFITMANPPVDHSAAQENRAYVMIGRHLHRKGIPLPEMFRWDYRRGWFIMEDLGSESLQDLVVRSSADCIPIYENVLEHLFRLQVEGADGFDTSWCCQTKRYDRMVMRSYEAHYFRDAFLCLFLGLKKDWPELETPFGYLAEAASSADGRFFLHRDFQSRNIMISGGDIGIIDWQGGRLGPLGYDLASLLIDPYTELSPDKIEHLYQCYLLMIRGHNAGWLEPFQRYYPYLAIQRNLQILGAFSYLSKVRGKEYFEVFIPGALRTLNDLLQRVKDPELSPLRRLVNGLRP